VVFFCQFLIRPASLFPPARDNPPTLPAFRNLQAGSNRSFVFRRVRSLCFFALHSSVSLAGFLDSTRALSYRLLRLKVPVAAVSFRRPVFFSFAHQAVVIRSYQIPPPLFTLFVSRVRLKSPATDPFFFLCSLLLSFAYYLFAFKSSASLYPLGPSSFGPNRWPSGFVLSMSNSRFFSLFLLLYHRGFPLRQPSHSFC